MTRLILKYAEQEVVMPRGESFIGRSLDCQLRFNDASISRRHLRVICREDDVHLENLSMTNGAVLNGQALLERCRLRDGDRVQIAHRILDVVLDENHTYEESEPLTIQSTRAGTEDETDWGDETKPGQLFEDGFDFRAINLGERNCPKCRERIANAKSTCHSCGYIWPSGGPAMSTQKIVVPEVIKRGGTRHLVRVPVIYSSEDLTLDVVARDLGRGGMFLASEILEPIGTKCQITALPNGRPALYLRAVVCHVSTEIVGGRPPGFGIQFSDLSKDAEEWLESTTGPKSRPATDES